MRELALPNGKHTPTCCGQRNDRFLVTRSVVSKLLLPEGSVVRWRRCIPAPLVLVPEAAVNKNDCTIARKNDVGLARHCAYVEAKAEAGGKQPTT